MRTGPEKIAVIGDGAMGTVCAFILADNGYEVQLWGAFPDNVADMAQRRQNRKYLPGFDLPRALRVTGKAEDILTDSDLVISAVPCQYMRNVWTKLAGLLLPGVPIISVTKGIENDTLARPTEILAKLTGSDRSLAALSGPTIAVELANRLPATAVVASTDADLARIGQHIFTTEFFRLYTNSDLLGVELAAASKNVIALAAGIIDGLGLGDNAKAALVTRGLVEITRLGLALGARRETFSGLAGLGDLVTTCISPLGRNRTVGEQIGKGRKLTDILSGMSAVAEGVATTRSLRALAQRCREDMPITARVYSVLFEDQDPRQAISQLMTRAPKSER
ncbi:MAG: NAD(P)H-dependent glycerol-3-phosphate dehydrogenase [Actinobacteria bacterium]|nr:NAD(P)H-dependent glycerol-3-phosphate dehydrogenase [Actinomycetota bacterium]